MKKLLAVMLFAGGSLFIPSASAGNFSIGVAIGAPPPARYYAMPAAPGPGYMWIDGFWYPRGGRYFWRSGYWALPPYAGGYWVAPRYSGGRYYNGYWGRGDRDRDGIRNRYDSYDNRYRGGRDRDRDGIPNRRDGYDNRRGYGYGFRR